MYMCVMYSLVCLVLVSQVLSQVLVLDERQHNVRSFVCYDDTEQTKNIHVIKRSHENSLLEELYVHPSIVDEF